MEHSTTSTTRAVRVARVGGLVFSVLVLCSVLSVLAYLALASPERRTEDEASLERREPKDGTPSRERTKGEVPSERRKPKDGTPPREWTWGYRDTGAEFAFPHASIGWPTPIRTDKLGRGSAISVEEIVFDDELTTGQVKSKTVEVRIVGFRSDGTSHESENIGAIRLATLNVVRVTIGERVQKCAVVNKSYDVGGDVGFSDCVAYTIGIRLTKGGPGNLRPELNVHFRYTKK